MDSLHRLYPSVDGNKASRDKMVSYLQYVLEQLDRMKDPNSLILGKEQLNSDSKTYYYMLAEQAFIPQEGHSIDQTLRQLIKLSEGHRVSNSNYLANASSMPNTASLVANFLMTLLNGNNLWDVEGSTSANVETQIVSMLSKLIGYDPAESGGYTTWGGQGATFTSLRIAISKRYPDANKKGVPRNLYCFCSELSHYSLHKSMEATGLGTDHLVKVKTNDDHSLNMNDLRKQMESVIAMGGVPLYVLTTMGTTDTFGIDSIKEVKAILTELEHKYNLRDIYLHADTAMGGMFAFFNEYNFSTNPLYIEKDVLYPLSNICEKYQHVNLADSLVFDFHKLGQTPYVSSLFLLKNKSDLHAVDLHPEETPYVGNKGFGHYHTSYTLECSRAGTSIPIYASLLTFGVEGYQRLLANYLSINLAFRKRLLKEFKFIAITNELSPITTFRFYHDRVKWEEEKKSLSTEQQIQATNELNEKLIESMGIDRKDLYFGSTRKQCTVKAVDTGNQVNITSHKFFSISPYTSIEDMDRYFHFLHKHVDEVLVMK
ncbi:aspartate aminotransferase family protein [Pontibacillus yanchengensis]|uniref:Aspartate aminotransferase family protein n=2 Tax=Pontibacillus yanchengensis TaxID=462910 RepID=A0ACC7VDA5_9BACI|nr:pyridoxal-dependent decarboxylase [Pontibacillus yanchengensis]MYL32381.1 aspartate aminotransferase family protein [Pontibacillus yanchengensis]MYL52961.1 aspartate aminotransferase family protein [Pontibacillus yanchengensis]